MTSRSERDTRSPAAQAAGFSHVRVGSRLRQGFSPINRQEIRQAWSAILIWASSPGALRKADVAGRPNQTPSLRDAAALAPIISVDFAVAFP
jgi:hypothetical protein